ncbi:MAG: peroxiredoxin family protein [Nitrospinota bacterium]
MNRVKSIFISAFMTGLFVMTFHTALKFVYYGFDPALLGALLAVGLPAGFFAYAIVNLFIKRMPRATLGIKLITIGTAVGAALAIYGSLTSDNIRALTLVYALTGFCGWVAYDKWYSYQGGSMNSRLTVGAELPSFDVENENGNKVSSDSFHGKPTLLIFYRGNWCPFCMSQIKEIALRYRELADKGARIALISPQPRKFTRNLAKKYDGPFIFLVDAGNRAARQLDIASIGGLPASMEIFGYHSDTVKPTAIITDKDGKIIYADLAEDYRVRPQPDDFLRVLEEQT